MYWRRLLICCIAVLTAACGTPPVDGSGSSGPHDVLTYRGDSARTGLMPGPGPSGTPQLAWTFAAHAFRPDGGFYVADAGNHRVQEFDKDRAFVREWGTFGAGPGQFATPSGIAIDGSGNVYVHDDDRIDTQEFTGEGTYVTTFCKGALSPLFTVDATGNVYCLNGQSLARYDHAGEKTLNVDLGGFITFGLDLAVGSDGHIFLTSVTTDQGIGPERLLELDADGTVLHVWPNGGEGLAIDPSGDQLYISFWKWDGLRAYALPVQP